MRLISSRLQMGILILTASMLFFGCSKNKPSGEKQILEVVGTGACEKILNTLAEAYNATQDEVTVAVPLSIGSGRGIETVGKDEYVLGRVGRPIKEKEAHYGLTYTVFAKDAIVFAAGKEVTAKNVTSQQLVDIYTGSISNWDQLGGQTGPIRVLTREEGDSSRSVIQKYIPEFKTMTINPQAKELYHDYEMIEALQSFPTSIGYCTGSSMPADLQLLSVNQFSPTHDEVASGTYPMVCDYAFVYKEKNLNQAARDFMNFVFSPKGKEILLANGLVEVNAP